jgi:butyryl-CoA dehydrogenase
MIGPLPAASGARLSASPLIDLRSLDFLLTQVLDFPEVFTWDAFAEHDLALAQQTIDLAHKLAVEKFATHRQLGDREEPVLVDGRVRIPDATRDALAEYADAGFSSLATRPEDGGLGLPYSLALICDALFFAANTSTTGYALLTRGATNLIATHGSEEQKQRYLPGLTSGRWFGTMCLSEPQAGSSLADIRTRAVVRGDGRYAISGAKMWISGGEHELSENIVHLLLAKIPGGPPGVRGISLFIVPRYRPDADGRPGTPNDVALAGLNHKLGQRGIVNTFLKFGENDDCIGELVGAPHAGLAQMFHMMNEARIGVGVSAIMQGYAGYLYALGYARERRQGRHPDQRDPTTPPLALIEHVDVRRMLLQQRAYVEGAFALALYAALLVDAKAHAPQPERRVESALLLDLLTPVVKAWSSDWTLKANELAIQVLGGYGYTRDYPVEQYYRDNRLNPIHEGANGIQALDLLGRKVGADGGRALALLDRAMAASADSARELGELAELADVLDDYRRRLAATTQSALARIGAGQVRAALANATPYASAFGHIAIAWMWLRQAEAAVRALRDDAVTDADFYRGKLQTCRFFFAQELPAAAHWLALAASAEDSALAMQDAWF